MPSDTEFARTCYEKCIAKSTENYRPWFTLNEPAREQVRRLTNVILDEVIERRWIPWRVELIEPGAVNSRTELILAATGDEAFEAAQIEFFGATILSVECRVGVARSDRFYPPGTIDPGEMLTDLSYVDGHLRDGVRTIESWNYQLPGHFRSALEWCGRITSKLRANSSSNN